MAQHRYPSPAYRIGPTKSLIWQIVNTNLRATQLWHEASARIDKLVALGMEPDPDLIAKDPEILMLVQEIEPEMWRRVVEGGPPSGTVSGPIV